MLTNKRHRKIRTISLTLLSFLLILSLATTPSFAALMQTKSTKTVKLTGTYHQSDARKMSKMVNQFRTGKEAWYYTQSGSKQKVKKLKKLTYDYALEKVAMKRAAEIAVSFSHTRPNGKLCFSAFPSGYYWMGENIAYGTAFYMTPKKTLNLWKETNESYDGQGHRRNMLSRNYTSVGIACFEYNGCKYWVQEFGAPRSNKAKTKACNSKKTVSVKVK